MAASQLSLLASATSARRPPPKLTPPGPSNAATRSWTGPAVPTAGARSRRLERGDGIGRRSPDGTPLPSCAARLIYAAAAAWSMAGDWTLQFSGRADRVRPRARPLVRPQGRRRPLHVLRRGPRRRHGAEAPGGAQLWKDFTPPVEWTDFPSVSHLVHLGSTRFCIARFFTTNPFASSILHLPGHPPTRCSPPLRWSDVAPPMEGFAW